VPASDRQPISATAPAPWHRRFFRWILLWLVLYAAAIVAYNASYAFTRNVLIFNLQVRPAAWIVAMTLPGEPIGRDEEAIFAPGLRMEIRRGCDGMEAWLLLMTALVVFPMPWSRRARAMLSGTALVFGLNLLRIVSMFHLVRWRPEWFDVVHGLIWQSVMVLAAGLFVLSRFEAAPAHRLPSPGES
jgi:exosortase/archaeosortase family protein